MNDKIVEYTTFIHTKSGKPFSAKQKTWLLVHCYGQLIREDEYFGSMNNKAYDLAVKIEDFDITVHEKREVYNTATQNESCGAVRR